jgi:hypothetical protein
VELEPGLADLEVCSAIEVGSLLVAFVIIGALSPLGW